MYLKWKKRKDTYYPHYIPQNISTLPLTKWSYTNSPSKNGKSKALVVTLSDTEPEDDSDNEDDGILNAFTVTINPIDGIVEDVVEEEELV